jgi:hypothetical protein
MYVRQEGRQRDIFVSSAVDLTTEILRMSDISGPFKADSIIPKTGRKK